MTGEVYKMELDGTVLGRFGKAGHAFKEFSSIHQMDCRNPNEIYVAEITAWRGQNKTPPPNHPPTPPRQEENTKKQHTPPQSSPTPPRPPRPPGPRPPPTPPPTHP